jgi:4-hydroxy-tetrahydrodipicolinate reductase
MKKIAMFGICGKMGVSMTRELIKEKDMEICAGFDISRVGEDIGSVIGCGRMLGKKVSGSYSEILELKPDIIIDFTNAQTAFKTAKWAIENNMDLIIGATGLGKDELKDIESATCKSTGKVFVIPNFSIGAVLMMKVSGMIAKYFDNCEIIELHHDKKKDAPSVTSIFTDENIANQKIFNGLRLKDGETEVLESSRGAFTGGVHIHSVRMPGYLAHQEVIFGTAGQTLTIRHDSIDRLSFYPGLLLAIKNIEGLSSYTYGLDKVIEL